MESIIRAALIGISLNDRWQCLAVLIISKNWELGNDSADKEDIDSMHEGAELG